MRKIAIALVAASALAGSGLAAEDKTSTELRKLDARQADRQAREDLLSILEPIKQYPTGMRRTIGSVWFDTKPYGTAFRGLCARDVLELNYSLTGTAGRPEDIPVRPVGVGAFTNYRFLRKPADKALETIGSGEGEKGAWRAECTHAGTEDAPGWFSAADPETAVRGYLALQAALARVKDGSLALTRCDIPYGSGLRDCAAAIAKAAEPQNLRAIELLPCETGKECFRIDSLGLWITIEVTAGGHDRAVEPADVLSVEAVEYITVT